jgi:hypothetical protein
MKAVILFLMRNLSAEKLEAILREAVKLLEGFHLHRDPRKEKKPAEAGN